MKISPEIGDVMIKAYKDEAKSRHRRSLKRSVKNAVPPKREQKTEKKPINQQ